MLLDDGTTARAAVPSGASTGAFEAVERRDGDKGRYGGKGVQDAVSAVLEQIGPALVGLRGERAAPGRPGDARPRRHRQQGLARRQRHPRRLARRREGGRRLRRPAAVPLPRRPERARAARADAQHPQRRRARRQRRRHPGVHDRADRRRRRSARRCAGAPRPTTRSSPCSRARASRPASATRAGSPPSLPANRDALDLIATAIEQAGFTLGTDIALALDVAATEFYTEGVYRFEGAQRSSRRDDRLLRGLVDAYPLVSIEDPLAEDDWEGWTALTAALGDRVQLVGDDLFVTNPERLQRGIDAGAANALLVKVNQIGTLTETLDAVDLAHRSGYRMHDEPPLRRDRGHHDRRPRGRRRTPARSRRARRPGRSASPSTTSCCGSRRSSTTPRSTPGRRAFPRRRG